VARAGAQLMASALRLDDHFSRVAAGNTSASFRQHCSSVCSIQSPESDVFAVLLSIMAQAGPVTDVVQRLFTELKSKNEEARVRASFELYDNVLTVSRGMPCSFISEWTVY
jgi:hypothetical protein